MTAMIERKQRFDGKNNHLIETLVTEPTLKNVTCLSLFYRQLHRANSIPTRVEFNYNFLHTHFNAMGIFFFQKEIYFSMARLFIVPGDCRVEI